jgi:hypothetical protein
MAAFPCCTDETRRPGMQARRSVISLAALARGVRQSNAKNNSRAQLVGGGLLQRDEIAASPGALALIDDRAQRHRRLDRLEGCGGDADAGCKRRRWGRSTTAISLGRPTPFVGHPARSVAPTGGRTFSSSFKPLLPRQQDRPSRPSRRSSASRQATAAAASAPRPSRPPTKDRTPLLWSG